MAPPAVFLAAALLLIWILGLFMPLVALITNLTGGPITVLSGPYRPQSEVSRSIAQTPPPILPPALSAVAAALGEVLAASCVLIVVAWLIVRTPKLFAVLGMLAILAFVCIGSRNKTELVGILASGSIVLMSLAVAVLQRRPWPAPPPTIFYVTRSGIVACIAALFILLALVLVAGPIAFIFWLAVVSFAGMVTFRYRQLRAASAR